MSKGEPFTTELLFDHIYENHSVLKDLGSTKERRRMRVLLRKQEKITFDEHEEGPLTIQLGRLSAYFRLRNIIPNGKECPTILRVSNETIDEIMQVNYIYIRNYFV